MSKRARNEGFIKVCVRILTENIGERELKGKILHAKLKPRQKLKNMNRCTGA